MPPFPRDEATEVWWRCEDRRVRSDRSRAAAVIVVSDPTAHSGYFGHNDLHNQGEPVGTDTTIFTTERPSQPANGFLASCNAYGLVSGAKRYIRPGTPEIRRNGDPP